MPSKLEMGNDLGTHITLTGIDITFPSDFKPNKELTIRIGRSERKAIRKEQDPDGTNKWVLDPGLRIFDNDTLDIQIHRRVLGILKLSGKAVLLTLPGQLLIYETFTNGPNPSSRYYTIVYHKNLLSNAIVTVPTKDDGLCLDMRFSGSLRSFENREMRHLSSPLPSSHDLSLSPDDILTSLDKVQGCLTFMTTYGGSALDVIVKFADEFAQIHPIAQAVVKTLALPYKLWQNEQAYIGDLKDVVDEIKSLLALISDAMAAAQREYVKESVVEIIKAILEADSLVDDYLKHSRAGRLVKSQFRTGLDDYQKKLKTLGDRFNQAMIVQSGRGIQELVSNRNEAFLRKHLCPMSPDANEPPRPSCLPGTRREIIAEIDAWLEDPGEKNILWIYGQPGAGKSALMSTIFANHRGRCASVFIKGDTAGRREPHLIWRSIGFELSERSPEISEQLVKLVESGKDYFQAVDMQQQFEDIVKSPLEKCTSFGPEGTLFALIDALDESDTGDSWKSLLETLDLWKKLPKKFKLIIASRKYPEISKVLEPVSKVMELRTGDRVDEATHRDIRIYLEDRFWRLSKRLTLPEKWPGAQKLQELTGLAAGLFIWAKVAMEFMESGDPTEQLDSIPGDLGAGQRNIELLYEQVLRRAFETSEKERRRLQTLLGIVVLARNPLTVSDIRILMNMSDTEEQVINSAEKLKAVIYTDGANQSLRVCHKSFADFLTSTENGPAKISSYAQTCFVDIGKACLKVLNRELKFNICQLQTSYLFHDDIPGLPKVVQDCISPQLRYASLYWADHIGEITPTEKVDDHVENLLRSLLEKKILYWMEVMSLTENFGRCPEILLDISILNGVEGNLRSMAEDCSIFCVTFSEVISRSIPHIYISALPFAAQSSSIFRLYGPLFANSFKVTEGRDVVWSRLRMKLTDHHDEVLSVAFSPDGDRIVSGSEDKTIRVWDAKTGKSVTVPIRGHDGTVWSVAFSPDGDRIVSGSSDQTIRVWDAKTGKSVTEPIRGHNGVVFSVAFLPDGDRIVSGSSDNTIRVWDAKTGKSVTEPIRGHDSTVWSVALSPDGDRIVSGSSDQTIRVWDAKTGKSVTEPIRGHHGMVFSVAFSPDGDRIVSGSSDDTIRVWDAKTGKSVTKPIRGHNGIVLSVAFSPDGDRIVSGSGDHTIRVWDAETGKSITEPIRGHDGTVWSVAFPPDGDRIVSGSLDHTIRVWDAKTGKRVTEPIRGHYGPVRSVAFSPDGDRIVSGSEDKTIRVWDAKTGKSVTKPIRGHDGTVLSVAFSPDGDRIVSGSSDQTIRVWDAKTGKSVTEPIRAHDGPVLSVEFSPDGDRIVSGSSNDTIRVWDAKTGKRITEPIRGHYGPVRSVALSPDGDRIVSGFSDSTIRVWDGKTRKSVTEPIRGHNGTIWSVAFSPDGNRIVSGSEDETIRTFDVSRLSSNPNSRGLHTSILDGCAISTDGWIYLHNSSLPRKQIFWVPPANRLSFFWPRCEVVIGGRPTKVDLTAFRHGELWEECKTS